MKLLEQISNEIIALESERDFGKITPKELELLATLNLCYDLLTRTKTAQSILVKQPEEMKEEGPEDNMVPVYGVPSSPLADFAFAVITKQKVDMRKLLLGLIGRTTRVSISEKTGISPATISEYLNYHKRSMTCDNYEKIINAL